MEDLASTIMAGIDDQMYFEKKKKNAGAMLGTLTTYATSKLFQQEETRQCKPVQQPSSATG